MPALTQGRALWPLLFGGLFAALAFAAVGVALHGRGPAAGLLAPVLHYAAFGLASGMVCAGIDLARRPARLPTSGGAASHAASGHALPAPVIASAAGQATVMPRRTAAATGAARRSPTPPERTAVPSAFGT